MTATTNHKNNFGLLRLLLASLVIFGHSPELIDGNRGREVLTSLFGTLSFGELAVDGFFLISGYLILKSYYASSSLQSYLLKRCLRIYPGFIVASMMCIFVVAPLSGGLNLLTEITLSQWFKSLARLVLLDAPSVAGAFLNNPYPVMNGSMWTIWLEFMCYFSIPVFALLGLHNKKIFLFATLFVAAIYLYTQLTSFNIWLPYPLRLDLHHSTRLLLAFLIGGCFHIYRDFIVWKKRYAMASAIALTVCLFQPWLAELALFIFGGYLLFYFALCVKHETLNSVGVKTDISYGIYLYAWPVQSLFVQYYPTIQPYQLNLLTLLIAGMLGYMSWRLIEQPCMQFKKRIS